MFQADFKIDVICLKEIFQNLFNRFPPHLVQMLIRGDKRSHSGDVLMTVRVPNEMLLVEWAAV